MSDALPLTVPLSQVGHYLALGRAADAIKGASGSAPGPVSDPIVQSINANGWSVTTSNNPAAMEPEGANAKFLYVLRKGFNAAAQAITFIDKLALTKRIRLPWSQHLTLTTNQCALSDFVYQDDVVVGIPNGSTKRSPKPIMNWARVDRRIIGNTLRVEAVAFHRDARDGKTLACAEFIVSDGTNSVTAKVANMSILNHSGDKNAVIGYAYDFDLTSLTDLSAITVTGNGYPHVGAAVSIRASNGAADSREFRALRYFKNVAKHASPPIAVVSSSGVDASGVVSLTEATAAASPFLTIAGAANGLRLATALTGGFTDGCEIRIADSEVATGSFLAVTFQSQYELTITKLSTVTRAQARLAMTASTGWRHTAIRFRDITVNRSNTAQFSGIRSVFESLVLNNNSINAAVFAGAAGTGYMLGVTVNGAMATNFGAGTAALHMARGVEIVGGTTQIEPWLVLGCRFRNGTNSSNRGTRTLNGSIIAFNEYYGITGQWTSVGADENITEGAVRAQNVVEGVSTTMANMFAPSADGQQGDVTGLIDWHNTFVGDREICRTNMLYNETSGKQRTHELTSSIGHVTTQFNTKHDIFSGANNAYPDASERIGAWSVVYGVGFEGLFSCFRAANPTSEHPEFAGMGASLGTSATVKNDPLFVDNKAVIASPLTAGAGNGNYRLQAGSPLIGRVKKRVLPFDLDGNPRGVNGTASGAYEFIAA